MYHWSTCDMELQLHVTMAQEAQAQWTCMAWTVKTFRVNGLIGRYQLSVVKLRPNQLLTNSTTQPISNCRKTKTKVIAWLLSTTAQLKTSIRQILWKAPQKCPLILHQNCKKTTLWTAALNLIENIEKILSHIFFQTFPEASVLSFVTMPAYCLPNIILNQASFRPRVRQIFSDLLLILKLFSKWLI